MSGCQTTQRLLFFAQHQLSAYSLLYGTSVWRADFLSVLKFCLTRNRQKNPYKKQDRGSV